MNNIPGLPGGCNPADVLYKLAHGRGIWPPVFAYVSEQGPPHARTFTWSCSFLEVKEIVLLNAPPTNFKVTFTLIALLIIPSLPSQGQYSSIGQGRSKKEAKNGIYLQPKRGTTRGKG